MFGVLELATRRYVTLWFPRHRRPRSSEPPATSTRSITSSWNTTAMAGKRSSTQPPPMNGRNTSRPTTTRLCPRFTLSRTARSTRRSRCHPGSDSDTVVVTRERSIAVPSAINAGTGGQRLSRSLYRCAGEVPDPPYGRCRSRTGCSTGDRDARRRRTVPANQRVGSSRWKPPTEPRATSCRSSGVRRTGSSLTITGDVPHWTRCLDSMRIPAPLVRSVDDNNNTLTVSYA